MTDDMRRFMRKHFGGGDFNDLPFVKSIRQDAAEEIFKAIVIINNKFLWKDGKYVVRDEYVIAMMELEKKWCKK